MKEMLVHGMRTRQKLTELVWPNGNGQRQTDGRPQRITAAHPIPKSKTSLNAKLTCGFHIGGECRKVTRHIGAALRFKPTLGRQGIGHGFQSGEGFGGHQEQGVLCLQAVQYGIQLMAIHIGHKVKTLAPHGI